MAELARCGHPSAGVPALPNSLIYGPNSSPIAMRRPPARPHLQLLRDPRGDHGWLRQLRGDQGAGAEARYAETAPTGLRLRGLQDTELPTADHLEGLFEIRHFVVPEAIMKAMLQFCRILRLITRSRPRPE
jgi:hypothetical protein